MASRLRDEIVTLVTQSSRDRYVVVTALLEVWSYFDTHTKNGSLPCSHKSIIDQLTGMSGFSDAMIEVGWLAEKEGKIFLPNFNRHNGSTSKKRAASAIRASRYRARRGSDERHASVTQDAQQVRDQEKNREEKENTPLPPLVGGDGAMNGSSKKARRPRERSMSDAEKIEYMRQRQEGLL
jgi:hypothetical protein